MKTVKVELSINECYLIMLAFETEIEDTKKEIKKAKKHVSQELIDESLEDLKVQEQLHDKFAKIFFDENNPLNNSKFTN